MHTDLFLALLDENNPRGHPILAALIYAFCPAAARWWLAGADPVVPFDPSWQALEDLAAGSTLREALCRYGFEDLVDVAREYVSQVDAWRDRHPGIHAPETLPTFSGGRISVSQRFGSQSAIEKLGGRWENFFAYIRTWAFICRDWEAAMRFPVPSEFASVRLAFSLPGIRRPAHFTTWSWVSRVKSAIRTVIGFVVVDNEQEQLRLGLARRASPVGDKPWPSPPEVWALEWGNGTADHFDDRLPDNALPSVIERLAEMAQSGPYPPLAALGGSARCDYCGFCAQCFTNTGEISLLTLTPRT
jgi:hypothetical protein